MVQHGQEKVNFDDVSNEIFDMCRPNEPDRIEIWIIWHLLKSHQNFLPDETIFQISKRITCNDLIRSGQGHVVINILSDLNGFWSYENREMIFAEANEEDVWFWIIQYQS